MARAPNSLSDPAREALRVSESRYRRLFETARDGILLLNADTAQIEDVNPYLVEMLGYSHAEFLGKKLWEVGPFSDRAESKEMFAELQAKGYVRYDDLPLRTKAGAQIEVEFVSNTYDCEGIKVIQCNIRDISDRKKAENEALARELRYQAVATTANDAFVTSDATGHIVSWNPAAERIFGYPEAEIIGQPLTLLIPQRFHTQHLDGMKRAGSGGARRAIGKTVEQIGRRKDASEFPLELSLAEWTVGKAQFFTGIIHDITERKAADAKLQRQMQLYAALSQCNEAIVRCASEDELFPKICRAAVEFGGMKMAWIGIVNPDTHMIRVAASFGDRADEYLQGVAISMDADGPLGHSPSATAIRDNQPVWHRDIEHSPLTAPLHERRASFGWGASVSLPLRRNGVPIGVLTLYVSEVGAFDEAARNLLIEMATDISFALDTFAHESQRELAERSLLRENHRNQIFLQNASDGVHILDADGNVLQVSDSFCKMLGYSRQELIGANVSLWDAQWSPQELKQEIAEQMAKEGCSLFETRHRRRDGSFLDVEITGQRLELDGKPVVFNSARDITERIRAEQQLTEAEAQFRSLVEQTIAGIYIIQDSKLVYVNPRFSEIFGYNSADELIGHDALSVVAENERAAVGENISKWLKEGTRTISHNTTGLRKNGSTIDVGVQGTRAIYRGRPAIIGLLQDISEKRHAEEEIQLYIGRLQNAVMSIVEVATAIGEMRDPYTAGHERRVAGIAVAIGAELGFDANRRAGLRIAGQMHDIGKITIPTEILSKPGKLTAIELQLIQGHAQASYDVLRGVEWSWPVAQVALQHHERMDGSGYPQGLKGEAILLEARIMAVADVVEAMSSHRPYRAALGTARALAEIERGRGSAYDAKVVDACLRVFREKRYQLSP